MLPGRNCSVCIVITLESGTFRDSIRPPLHPQVLEQLSIHVFILGLLLLGTLELHI
jgi:hypothetical protein